MQLKYFTNKEGHYILDRSVDNTIGCNYFETKTQRGHMKAIYKKEYNQNEIERIFDSLSKIVLKEKLEELALDENQNLDYYCITGYFKEYNNGLSNKKLINDDYMVLEFHTTLTTKILINSNNIKNNFFMMFKSFFRSLFSSYHKD